MSLFEAILIKPLEVYCTVVLMAAMLYLCCLSLFNSELKRLASKYSS